MNEVNEMVERVKAAIAEIPVALDDAVWDHVAGLAARAAIEAQSRGIEGFLETIKARTPNGEYILVQYHPNGDWSVSNEPQVIYGDGDDIEVSDAEFETLMDIGHAVAGTLSEFAAPGDSIDTGVGMGEYEAFVTVGDLEYRVKVSPYCRPSEVESAFVAPVGEGEGTPESAARQAP